MFERMKKGSALRQIKVRPFADFGCAFWRRSAGRSEKWEV